MNDATKLPLVITMGEPGGISGELTVKAWEALSKSGPVFFVIDDPDRLAAYGGLVTTISSPEHAASVFAHALPVLSLDKPVTATPGIASPDTALSVISSIERAVALTLEGKASGIITNPIQKSALTASGFKFPGHTEFLGALTANSPMPVHRTRGPIMMLASSKLRVVPATVHIPLSEAPLRLTKALIIDTARITAEALQYDFGIENPRLSIAGLNPHAGEDGIFGDQEQSIIAPAISALNDLGIDVLGPVSADSMFHAEARKRYDAAICMYHDQALIPVKTLDFHQTVNITLGLPIIRTSPDHGTALDIAGQGIARPDSLISAIQLAAFVSEHRRATKG